jgi:hypothetical protein
MSETPAAPAPEVIAIPTIAVTPAGVACPLTLEALSVNFRKHVDPGAPAPLRMMGAKGLVPMGPKEMTTALFMLTYDADTGIRETATKSATGLPDKILSVALRDETLEAPVLDYFAVLLAAKPEYLEMIVMNGATSDETVARVAKGATEKILEMISQNQLRILRGPEIARALASNPNTRPSTVDSVCDFCVRSGLVLEDLPAFKAARRRIHGGSDGDDAAAAAAAAKLELEQHAAEEHLVQMGVAGPDARDAAERTSDIEAQTRKLTVQQQLMKLSVAKKIEWANKRGNKEVRTILLRDPNKLVQLAVVHSPRITEDEIVKLSLSRVLPQEVLMYIYNNRQLTKNYSIKVNLVNNPKVPVAVSMRFLSLLRASELKTLAKNKNVPNALATAARNLVEKKNSGGG